MTYSIDMRQKVLSIQEKEGLTFAEAAKRFGIGIASLVLAQPHRACHEAR